MEVTNPRLSIPSRFKLSDVTCTLLYKNVREAINRKLAQDLKSSYGVGFTTDAWTSRKNQGYVALTLHYIDSEWKLQSFTMDCRMLPGSHSGEALARCIDSMLEKISALPADCEKCFTTDAENKMVKAIRESSSTRHIKCVAHAINNSLKAALFKNPDVKALMKTVSKLVAGCHRSSTKNDLIRSVADDMEGKRVFLLPPLQSGLFLS